MLTPSFKLTIAAIGATLIARLVYCYCSEISAAFTALLK